MPIILSHAHRCAHDSETKTTVPSVPSGPSEIDGKSRHASIGAADTRACEDRESVRRPYRPLPRNFVERWPRVGWSGAEMEWHAHARTVSRWLNECGRSEMIMARKAYLDAERAVQGRARRKRYVMGRTLTPIEPKTPSR